jgi:hypothetical protein
MIAVRASASGGEPNLSAQTGAKTAMTAFSELVLAIFFGRILAHEAETVREQEHTYSHSTHSGPQRGFTTSLRKFYAH